jgi:hypothetical protein
MRGTSSLGGIIRGGRTLGSLSGTVFTEAPLAGTTAIPHVGIAPATPAPAPSGGISTTTKLAVGAAVAGAVFFLIRRKRR